MITKYKEENNINKLTLTNYVNMETTRTSALFHKNRYILTNTEKEKS